MLETNIKSPGVYINEVNAFPNSVVPVATAVPAFIGYTPQAMYEGKSYTMVPQKVISFAEFEAIYCIPDPPAPANPAKQYNPEYYLIEQKEMPTKGKYLQIAGKFYSIVPDPNTIYYMYNMIKMFYDNGGGDAYIVSVGSYGDPSKKAMEPGIQTINTNVKLDDLKDGLKLLENEIEPTMYLCPEATLLTPDNNADLMQSMLLQNMEMMSNISIFDIIGGDDPDPILFMDDIEAFRNSTGANGLDYGTAYYPFIGTTVMQTSDIDYTNLFGGDLKQLDAVLNPPAQSNNVAATIISNIETPPGDPLTLSQYNNALVTASKTYSLIIKSVLESANMMPPSGAMAGVMTTTDNQEGVWKAPANTSIVGAAHLPIRLSEVQQGGLNMDAVSGKSINAIRFFNGLGILVWGARTLDGNSLDWKYLPVRRTMIFLEQSCKLAAQSYVFEPNVKNTWESIKAMISSFLNVVWKEGGLQGAKAADAFSVECGLGTTMTAEDILNGFLKVSVKVAVVRPAEFIVITFMQQMAKSS